MIYEEQLCFFLEMIFAIEVSSYRLKKNNQSTGSLAMLVTGTHAPN